MIFLPLTCSEALNNRARAMRLRDLEDLKIDRVKELLFASGDLKVPESLSNAFFEAGGALLRS